MQFYDCHAHTRRSYCATEAMSPEAYARSLEISAGHGGQALTDHAFQLCFPEEVAWGFEFMRRPEMWDRNLPYATDQIRYHLAWLAPWRPRFAVGIEAEMMEDGRLTFPPEFREEFDVVLGAVHWLSVPDGRTSETALLDFHLAHVARLVQRGIDVLAHPFRWLESRVPSIPEGYVREVVQLAVAAGVALEINSHKMVDADLPMIRATVAAGGVLAFGTDAHEAREIGRFDYHRSLLEKAGLRGQDLQVFDFRERMAAVGPYP